MNTSVRNTFLTILGVTVLLASGCVGIPAKITGGGSMASTSDDPKHKAHIGFTATDCNSNEIFDGTGQLNYIDKKAPGFDGGVKFHGDILEANQCAVEGATDLGLGCVFCAFALAEEDPFGAQWTPEQALVVLAEAEFKGIVVEYRSTNPKVPGDGIAVLCAADFGEGGGGLNDFAILANIDEAEGPYEGYFNVSPVKGNVQMHSCTCSDGIDNDDDGVTDEADLDCQFEDGSYNANGDEDTSDPS